MVFVALIIIVIIIKAHHPGAPSHTPGQLQDTPGSPNQQFCLAMLTDKSAQHLTIPSKQPRQRTEITEIANHDSFKYVFVR
jgi:hypothetical protein